MSSQYQIYRKFYYFTYSNSGKTTILFNPVFLSANTFVAGSADTQSNTIVETNLAVSQTQIGIYYVNLNPVYYSTDVVYDLVWYVTYTNNADENGTIHQLTTRFKINNIQFLSNPLSVDVLNNTLGIQIIENSNVSIDIINNTLGVDIINGGLDEITEI